MLLHLLLLSFFDDDDDDDGTFRRSQDGITCPKPDSAAQPDAENRGRDRKRDGEVRKLRPGW